VSARPLPRRLAPEDLDLLLSRSLDGDLSPEEEASLQEILASDPAAARRRDALAAVLEELKSLPSPATPFALATRVNSQVAERSSGLGSTWHRFGFYPPPGLVAAGLALVGFTAVIVGVLRPGPPHAAPVQVAASQPKPAEGPVTVFFEAKEAQEKNSKAKEPKDPSPRSNQKADRARPAAEALSKTAAKAKLAQVSAVTEQTADNLAPPAAPAPASLPAPTAGGALASAAPRERDEARLAPGARAGLNSPLADSRKQVLRWSIAVTGPTDKPRTWSLRKAPEATPSRAFRAAYWLRLDASGHVAVMRLMWGTPMNEVEDLVRGLVFDPVPGAPHDENREVEVEVGAR
jgi:hypothetical protein